VVVPLTAEPKRLSQFPKTQWQSVAASRERPKPKTARNPPRKGLEEGYAKST